jgi:hypothetical protein
MSKSLIGVAMFALLWLACAKQSTLRSVEKNINTKFQQVDLDFKNTQSLIASRQALDSAFALTLAEKLGKRSEESEKRFGVIYDSLLAQSREHARQLELLKLIEKRRWPKDPKPQTDTADSLSHKQMLDAMRAMLAQIPNPKVNVYPSTLIIFDSLHAGEFTLIRPQGRKAQEAFVLQYIPILLDSAKALAQGNATVSYDLRLELLQPRDTKDFIAWLPSAHAGSKSWWAEVGDFFQKLFAGNADAEVTLPNESLALLSEVFSVSHAQKWEREFNYLEANERFDCSFLLRIHSKTANPHFKPALRLYHHQLEYVNWWRRNLSELLLGLVVSLASFILGRMWNKLPFKLPFQNRTRNQES